MMTRPLPVIDDLQIDHPCPARWDAMPGDDRTRHCAACGRSVHDLSVLTAVEAVSLLGGPAVPCVRVHRRADGSVVTRDSAADRARWVLTRVLLTAASWAGLTLAVGCREEGRRTTVGSPKSHDRFEPPAAPVPEAPAPRPVATPRPPADGGDQLR